MKILIVDDSTIIRCVIEKNLRALNLEICGSVDNGKDAVEAYGRLRPDLVTMDITMPRMDGLAALGEIMAMDGEAKVLIISALKDRKTGIEALKMGAVGFLPKPFTPLQLTEEIKQIIDEIGENAS